MKKVDIQIKGMHCKSCEMLLEDAFEELGVKSSRVDFSKNNAIVEFDDKTVNIDQLKKTIVDEGYSVSKIEER